MVCSRRSKRGFSLIEMAIVLVVIGIVLSGGLLAVSPVLESSKGNETNSKLGPIDIQDSLTPECVIHGTPDFSIWGSIYGQTV